MAREKKVYGIRLGDFEFQCPKCKDKVHKAAYCIAQQASGHSIIYTCTCGCKMVVPR